MQTIQQLRHHLEIIEHGEGILTRILDKEIAEKNALEEKVKDLELRLKIFFEEMEKKAANKENATRDKLQAIQDQIKEAVTLNLTRLRDSIQMARRWSNEQQVGNIGQQIIDIVERALPK